MKPIYNNYKNLSKSSNLLYSQKLFNKLFSNKLLFLCILILIISITSVVAIPSPKGLPSCCPVQVNEGAIIEYNTKEALKLYPDSGHCLNDNRVEIKCEAKRAEYIKKQSEKDRLQVEEDIKSCKEDFQKEVESYTEYMSSNCDISNPYRIKYFWPTHTLSSITKEELKQLSSDHTSLYNYNKNPPIWKYEVYTGALNGVDQFKTKSIDLFYWDKNNCNWKDPAKKYNNELKELTEPLYAEYCNNVKKDNIDMYTSCWNSDKLRLCENSCEEQHKDDWKLVSYEDEYSDLYDPDLYETRSLERSDCIMSCQDYSDAFENCMYDSFESKYCWVESYLSARESALGLCEQYYGIVSDYTLNKEFYKKAYENNFYSYSIGEGSIKLKYTCSKGMKYNEETGNCESIDAGKSSISFKLDKNVYKQGEDEFITGTITHICDGDCPGVMAYINTRTKDSSLSFDVVYDGDSFLTKTNSNINFKIKLANYRAQADATKSQEVLVYTDDKNTQKFTFIPQVVKDVQIIPNRMKFRNNEEIKVKVIVDGPKEGDYTYVLTSALDAEFIIDGEYKPIAAIVSSNKNKIEFGYKPPLISRVVYANDFYIEEMGQWSMEVLPSALKGLSEGLLAHGLGTKLNGVTVKGYKVTYDGVGQAVTGADSLLTWGMDGFISASYSALSLLGSTASAAVAVGDISYKTYQAYSRADERLNVFASKAEHDYPVPIKVDVKLAGNEPIKKAIKVTVTAPEAIVK